MKKILFILLLITIASCSNFKKDYVLVDASQKSAPNWVKNSKKKDTKDEKFFISKAENVNQRLCEKSASARATAVVASEIAQTLINKYTEITESKNLQADSKSKENLEQNISLFLAGIQNEQNYWEKRRYSKELGAENDVVKYQCYALLKMDAKNYNNILALSMEKMLENAKYKPELKNEIKSELINNLEINE